MTNFISKQSITQNQVNVPLICYALNNCNSMKFSYSTFCITYMRKNTYAFSVLLWLFIMRRIWQGSQGNFLHFFQYPTDKGTFTYTARSSQVKKITPASSCNQYAQNKLSLNVCVLQKCQWVPFRQFVFHRWNSFLA